VVIVARSNPYLQAVDVPDGPVPPNNTFRIDVIAGQGEGGDPWLSAGSCYSNNLDPTAWTTPVTLWVDGEMVDEKVLCMANNNTKNTQFSLSLSQDSQVTVKVHPVGDIHPGETWSDNLDEVADDVVTNISVETGADDPSNDSGEGLLAWLDTAAKRIGTSVNMLAIGIVVAFGVFLVI
jgi:hypothetical protein